MTGSPTDVYGIAISLGVTAGGLGSIVFARELAEMHSHMAHLFFSRVTVREGIILWRVFGVVFTAAGLVGLVASVWALF